MLDVVDVTPQPTKRQTDSLFAENWMGRGAVARKAFMGNHSEFVCDVHDLYIICINIVMFLMLVIVLKFDLPGSTTCHVLDSNPSSQTPV